MTTTGEKIRAFVALHPSAEVTERLRVRVEELRKELGSTGLKWAKTEQLHLTLQFLGYIPQSQAENFALATTRTVSQLGAFTLRAEALGCFPNLSRARVLWVGLTGETETLQRLKSALDVALSALGYHPETRPFHPHITLARISDLDAMQRQRLKQAVSDHESYRAGEFKVEKLELMQSILSPKGSTYQVLASSFLKTDETIPRKLRQ